MVKTTGDALALWAHGEVTAQRHKHQRCVFGCRNLCRAMRPYGGGAGGYGCIQGAAAMITPQPPRRLGCYYRVISVLYLTVRVAALEVTVP